MRISVKARLGAVAAAAAIATTGAVAASGAADAAVTHPGARVATALSIKAGKPVALHHFTTARVGGQLTAGTTPIRFKWVLLERQGPRGHWFPIRRELTRVHGWVVFRVFERKTGSFRLLFRGSPNFAPSVSAPVTITAASH
jgi:hypothetical protein